MSQRISIVGLLVLAATMLVAAPGASRNAEQPASDNAPYWTAERRANAIPRDVIVRDAPPTARVKPDWAGNGGKGGGGDDDGDTSTGTSNGSMWTANDQVAVTTGRVFFTLDGTDYACSGSAIDTSSDSVVLTAGHCVHDGDGGSWATNLTFYPGYDHGPSEDGAWEATALFTSVAWATSGDFDNDVGFAVVTQAGSGTLETELGGIIPSFATSQVADHHAFGYPVQPKFAWGEELAYCNGPVSTGVDGSSNLAMDCRMEGGSSGGPWRRTAADGSPSSTIDTVVSYGYSCCGLKGILFGPNFDSTEQAVFAQADDGSCDAGETCVSR